VTLAESTCRPADSDETFGLGVSDNGESRKKQKEKKAKTNNSLPKTQLIMKYLIHLQSCHESLQLTSPSFEVCPKK
jgi:hypothetical protein